MYILVKRNGSKSTRLTREALIVLQIHGQTILDWFGLLGVLVLGLLLLRLLVLGLDLLLLRLGGGCSGGGLKNNHNDYPNTTGYKVSQKE